MFDAIALWLCPLDATESKILLKFGPDSLRDNVVISWPLLPDSILQKPYFLSMPFGVSIW